MSMVTSLTMYPLQVRPTDMVLPTVSPIQAMILISVVGIVIFVLVILNIIKNKSNITALNEGFHPEPQIRRNYSVFALRKVVRSLRLDREKSKMLEFVLRNDKVVDPMRSLNSPNLLDRHFKRAFQALERTITSKTELDNKLAILFATRNIIESSLSTISTSSTRQIPDNTAAVLAVGNKNYPIRVVSARGEALVVEHPMSHSGSPLQLPRGSKVNLSFFTDTSKGFTVESRVLGSTHTSHTPLLQLVHSGQIKRLSNRRFRRRQTVISTAFYLVHTEVVGRKKENKMYVDKRMFSGSIMDISIGGCSLKTNTTLSSGQRIKIEITREDKSVVVALGEILRSEKSGAGIILHVKFLKIPRKSLNTINAMVYEYTDR